MRFHFAFFKCQTFVRNGHIKCSSHHPLLILNEIISQFNFWNWNFLYLGCHYCYNCTTYHSYFYYYYYVFYHQIKWKKLLYENWDNGIKLTLIKMRRPRKKLYLNWAGGYSFIVYKIPNEWKVFMKGVFDFIVFNIWKGKYVEQRLFICGRKSEGNFIILVFRCVIWLHDG